MWKLRNIYLYLVCFVTLMMMIAGTVGFIKGITDICFPVDYSYSEPVPANPTMDTSEQKKAKDESKRIQARNQANEIKRQMVGSITVVLVALPVFIYHWRKIENEKEESIKS